MATRSMTTYIPDIKRKLSPHCAGSLKIIKSISDSDDEKADPNNTTFLVSSNTVIDNRKKFLPTFNIKTPQPEIYKHSRNQSYSSQQLNNQQKVTLNSSQLYSKEKTNSDISSEFLFVSKPTKKVNNTIRKLKQL